MSRRVAAVAPGATDDVNSGYKKGSLWIDTVGQAAYRCTNAQVGGATWVQITPGSGSSGPTYRKHLLSYWPMNNYGSDATYNLIDLNRVQPLSCFASHPWSAGVSPFDDGLGSLYWDGTVNSQALSEDRASNDIRTEDFTWTVWVKPGQVGTSKLIMCKDNGSSIGFRLWQGTTVWYAQTAIDTATTTGLEAVSTVAVTTGGWQFLACGYNSVTEKIWCSVDLETKVETSVTSGSGATLHNPSRVFAIGRDSKNNNYKYVGHLRDATWWRKNLSITELTDLQGRGSLVHGWK